jgi:hypothetical protein
MFTEKWPNEYLRKVGVNLFGIYILVPRIPGSYKEQFLMISTSGLGYKHYLISWTQPNIFLVFNLFKQK